MTDQTWEEHFKNCGMCNKKGLPILLTRYAVASKKTGKENEWFEYPQGRMPDIAIPSDAPEINGLFKVADHDGSDFPLGDATMYTLRLLRPGGYVYVFFEKGKRWQGYCVTGDLCLRPFDVPEDPTRPLSDPDKEAQSPCRPEQFGTVAMCVTIPNAKDAGAIWIAYSDVRWSANVIEQYTNNVDNCRALNMRRFDVAQWMGSETDSQPHAGKIAELATRVAEFSPHSKVKSFNYLFSDNVWIYRETDGYTRLARQHNVPLDWLTQGPYDKRRSLLEQLIDKIAQKTGMSKAQIDAEAAPLQAAPVFIRDCDKLVKDKGVIVALDDPVGITADLGELINERLEAFVGQPRYKRPLVVGASILGLQDHIEDQGEQNWQKSVNDEYKTFVEKMIRKGKTPTPGELKPWFINPNNVTDFKTAEPDIVTKDDLREARGIAWNKYRFSKRPTTKQLKKWQQTHYPHIPPVMDEETGFEYFNCEYLEDADEKKTPEWGWERRYDEKPIYEFQKSFEPVKKAYDDICIDPLVKTYAKWMQSQMLASYFNGHFCKQTPECGAVYLDTYSECIGRMQDKEPVAKIIEKWCKKEVKDEENLFWNALTLNQKELGEMLMKASFDLNKIIEKYKDKDEVGLATMKAVTEIWSKVFETMKKSVLNAFYTGNVTVKAGEFQVPFVHWLAKLVQRHSAIVTKVMLEQCANGEMSPLIVSIGGINRTPIIIAEYTGRKGALAQSMFRLMFEQNSPDIPPKVWNEAINNRLKALGIKGANLHAGVKVSMPLALDWERFRKMGEGASFSRNLSPSEQKMLADSFARVFVKTSKMEVLEAIRNGSYDEVGYFWRNWKEAAADLAKKDAFGKRLTQLRAFAQRYYSLSETCYKLLNIAAMVAAHDAVLKSDGRETDKQIEAWGRFSAAAISFVGSMARSMEQLLLNLRIGERARYAWGAKWGSRLVGNRKHIGMLGKIGKGMASVGAFILSMVDVVKGIDQYVYKKNHGLGILYFLSATLGIASIIYSSLLTPAGLVLLLFAVTITVFIEVVKDNDIQTWIGRSLFGTEPDKYSNMEVEMKEFELAMEG